MAKKMRGWPSWKTSSTAVCATTEPKATTPTIQFGIVTYFMASVSGSACSLESVFTSVAVRDHAGEDRGDDGVDDRADDQRADDADRHVALRILRLLRRRRDGVEADVGEEDDRRAGGDAVEAVRRERVPVRRLHVLEADEDEEAEHDELDGHHPEVEAGRLADAPHQHDRDQRDDAEGQDVEDDRDAEDVRRGGHDLRHLRQRPCRSRRSASRGSTMPKPSSSVFM